MGKIKWPWKNMKMIIDDDGEKIVMNSRGKNMQMIIDDDGEKIVMNSSRKNLKMTINDDGEKIVMNSPEKNMKITIDSHNENIAIYGIKTPKYHLQLHNVGASIYRLSTPNKKGVFEEIALRYESPEDYLDNPDYFGCIVGRSAGRIANGKFKINNQQFTVPQNEGSNNLHSSGTGVSKRLWKGHIINNQIIFTINLKADDDHFPGDMKIVVTYEFKEDSFRIKYFAKTTAPTICNLTNHCYFNLSGNFTEKIMNHEITNSFEGLYSLDNALPKSFLPTNKMFRNQKQAKIGKLVADNPEFFGEMDGIDQPFKIKKGESFVLADEKSGRSLKITSSYPYLVFYTQNAPSPKLKNGVHNGVALEHQYLPNDVNMTANSDTILRPSEKYSEWTEYHF